MRYLVFFVLLSAIYPFIFGAKILFLSPIGSISHNNFFMGFAQPLAERGHQVTLVSPYSTGKKIENFNEVVLKSPSVAILLSNVFEQSLPSLINYFIDKVPAMCSEALATKEVQDLKKEHYDLIILSSFFGTCFVSLVHHFKVPLIYGSVAEIFVPMAQILGSHQIPSLIANPFLPTSSYPFSFWERFQIVTTDIIFAATDKFLFSPKMEAICRERGLCPPDMPPFSHFNANSSLTIVNSPKNLEWPPRPTMPHIIYAGGCHIVGNKNLPQDLEDWVNSSGDEGFIFFSLGSAFKPSDMPEKHRKVLMNVFGSLKQKVLWKWNEDTMENLPPNVRLGKWLPQQDLLAHPKMRLFITHGGLHSIMEATYYGVPIVGMPLFSDQKGNMGKAASEGWGLLMDWDKLEEETFKGLIHQAIHDENIRKISEKRAKLMRDVPRHPADEAVFWIEFVLRNDGAEHLRSPLHHMPIYVLYNMDVYAFWMVIFATIFWCTKYTLKLVFRLCSKNKQDKINKSKEKKKNV